MDAIFLLIPIALLMLVVACGFFFWASKNNQFDDMDGPSQRILLDDKQQRQQFRESEPELDE